MERRLVVVALAALLLMAAGCLQEEAGVSPRASSTIDERPDPFLEDAIEDDATSPEEANVTDKEEEFTTSTTALAETTLATTIALPEPDTCAYHCVEQGYTDGVCRLSGRHCNDAKGEGYDARGNRWCRLSQRGQKALDSCCCVMNQP